MQAKNNEDHVHPCPTLQVAAHKWLQTSPESAIECARSPEGAIRMCAIPRRRDVWRLSVSVSVCVSVCLCIPVSVPRSVSVSLSVRICFCLFLSLCVCVHARACARVCVRGRKKSVSCESRVT